MTALLVLLLKTLLVFAAAGLCLLALRRASAAARHLVCLLALAALLILPGLSVALPGWQMLPALTPPAAPTPVISAPVSPPTLTPIKPNSGGTGTEPVGVGPRAYPSVLPVAPSTAADATEPASPRPLPWPVLLLSVWTFGALLALARPLLGLWGIRQLSRLSIPVTDLPALTLADECAAALRLTCRPALRQAAVPVPMTWGSRQPVVLLPESAAQWPEDRLRAVLLHEMAHIRRHDWLGHRLADCVCALYWFHPLVWLTARRLRAESEAACDDLVLASGFPAPDYARHLLEIARALPPVSIFPQAAIAMAQTSQVENRLKMILDKTQSRRVLTRRVLITALGLGTVALVPLAALRPAAHAQTMPFTLAAPASASEPLALDANANPVGQAADVSVALAGVTEGGKSVGQWWDASGAALSQPVFDAEKAVQLAAVGGGSGQRGLLFVFRLPPSAQGVTAVFEAPNCASSSFGGMWTGKMAGQDGKTEAALNAETGGMRTLAALYPLSLKKTTLRAGIASGPWKIAAFEAITSGGDRGQTGRTGGIGQTFILSPPVETAKGPVLTITTDSQDDLRVVAVDAQGRELLPAIIGSESIEKLDQITAQFSLPLSQIKAFRVETRPFVWTEFKDIALHPVQ